MPSITTLIIIYLISTLFPLTIYFAQLILNKNNEKILILVGIIPLINIVFTLILICAGISILREKLIKKKIKNNRIYAITHVKFDNKTYKPYIKSYEKHN